ncbi:hypothetical protein [Altererythrobacter sp. ZODW24]|uniref:head-tail connector protein n=1 Tax=Altererythrobacter sp. ZODW24 TaxID=2185142 RepID=UPI000DF7C709|nr:hypothetical protein [Altererythrobacter sp. ZODW24]
MKRTILASADLAEAAVADLKTWLAISGSREDDALADLMLAAIDTCEGFTGTMPLEQSCEEAFTATTEWQALTTKPVQTITQVIGEQADGPRYIMPVEDYAIEMCADGSARMALVREGSAQRVFVRFTAGLIHEWSKLPGGLRHGIIRLAAHYYRERDSGDTSRTPPASVAALWQPWRQMRLS